MRELYAAFNAHDLDTAPAGMSDDVDWPNGWEGGRVHGREAARSYWTRQWAELDSRAEPVTISTRADGSIAVDVHQVARNLTGEGPGTGASFTSTSYATGWSRGWTSRSRPPAADTDNPRTSRSGCGAHL